MQPIAHCTAVILTGGESRRMGSDKARVLWAGTPLLEHVIGAIEPLFSDIWISVREKRANLLYPQVVDRAQERGPMVGIKAALEAVQTDWVFVIACDMPFISTRLIQHLATLRNQHDAVVPFAFDRLQPLFGFYHTRCLPLMDVRMKQGQRSMMRLLDALDTHILREQEVRRIDPELRSFISLDCMEDVRKMECLNE